VPRGGGDPPRRFEEEPGWRHALRRGLRTLLHRAPASLAFTASDVVELYLHRGAFEPALSDEDNEQDPDRWCSHAAWGQECWQVVSQWVWNLRCPAGQELRAQERRRARRWQSAHGVCGQHPQLPSLPGCREQCQWQGSATAKPRQVSVLLHPLVVGNEPLLWRDWSRREHRRACLQLVRHQRIEVSLPPPATASPRTADVILSRAQRAHSRLSWAVRLARNVRSEASGQVTIKLFGIPEDVAESIGLKQA
jgi:hypothetical protein